MTLIFISKYPTKRLKHIVYLRRFQSDYHRNDRPYIGLENIESWTGKLLDKSTYLDGSLADLTNDASLSHLFEKGDVLFGKLRPYLAKAWIAEFPGRASTELLVMEPIGIEPRFLRYVFLCRNFVDLVDGSTFGSKMPRADWSFIGNVNIPVPEWEIQLTIVDYLDRVTERLDALVASKQRLLELLAEKRHAFITHVVTHGLNPNVTLRDSGIIWLGMIPTHWEVRKVAWLFRERDERSQPDLPLLEVSIDSGVSLREFSTSKIESTAADFNTYKIARRDDIVFNKMRMWQGAVGAAPRPGLVSPDYVVAEPISTMISSYAALLFRTAAFSAECGRRSYGIVWDRLRLYWDGFRDIELPLPPASEQCSIAKGVAQEFESIDLFQAATERSVDLLRERRAALITAAVTGQIDVEEMAA